MIESAKSLPLVSEGKLELAVGSANNPSFPLLLPFGFDDSGPLKSGDGGLSLGQAWVAARRLLAGVARPR